MRLSAQACGGQAKCTNRGEGLVGRGGAKSIAVPIFGDTTVFQFVDTPSNYFPIGPLVQVFGEQPIYALPTILTRQKLWARIFARQF